MDRTTRLGSWKEIAAHLGRDVRTVQRWEKTEGLPVHRHAHLSRSSVFAFASEIDAWWEGRQATLNSEMASTPSRALGAVDQPSATDSIPAISAAGERPESPPAGSPRKWQWAGALLGAVALGLLGWGVLGHSRHHVPRQERIYRSPEQLTGGPAMASSVDLATALGALRRHDRRAAAQATQHLVDSFPEDPDAHVLRGECLLLIGQAERPASLQAAVETEIATLRRLDPASPYPDFFEARLENGWRAHWDDAPDRYAPLLARKDLDPELRALVLAYRGLVDQHNAQGLAFLEEAHQLAPDNALILRYLAQVLHYLNRNAEALQRAQQALALDPCAESHYAMAYGLCGLGIHSGAAEELAVAAALDSSPTYTIFRGMELLHAGRRTEALQVAQQVGEPSVPEYAYNLACLWALLGERQGALHELQHALTLGYKGTKYTRLDPDLAILHGDPQFEALLAAHPRGGR